MMENRHMPSDEYRRKLRNRHVLEAFCLAVAAAMIVLSVIFVLDIDRDLWVPETIAVLGGMLNIMLSIRAVLVNAWFFASGLFLAGCTCLGLLLYLHWT